MTTIGQLIKILIFLLLAAILAGVVLAGLALFGPGLVRSLAHGGDVGPTALPPHIGFPEFLILFVLVIPFFFVLLAMIIGALKGGGGPRRNKGDDLAPEDIQAMQEMYRGFEKLTERIEALEMILLDHSKKG